MWLTICVIQVIASQRQERVDLFGHSPEVPIRLEKPYNLPSNGVIGKQMNISGLQMSDGLGELEL
jgi:hypothetical protein